MRRGGAEMARFDLCKSSDVFRNARRSCRPTLCSDRFRHGTRVAHALAVDRSDHEQVDGVGPETLDGELGGPHVIGHRLPAVAHRLAARGELTSAAVLNGWQATNGPRAVVWGTAAIAVAMVTTRRVSLL